MMGSYWRFYKKTSYEYLRQFPFFKDLAQKKLDKIGQMTTGDSNKGSFVF